MSARDAILAGIRRSLGVSGADPERRAAVRDRLASAPRGIVPARGRVDAEERARLFHRMAAEAHATVIELRPDEVPLRIAEHLARRNLPAMIRMGADARLAALPWHSVPALAVRHGAASEADMATLSHARAGIAETGTLVLTSGTENPSTLNFLPALHFVAIDRDDILGDAESAIERVRGEGGTLPRTMNFVTGPSRSGDIEQTMILGAHGPRELVILVLARDTP